MGVVNEWEAGVELENEVVGKEYFIWKLPGRQLVTEGAVAE